MIITGFIFFLTFGVSFFWFWGEMLYFVRYCETDLWNMTYLLLLTNLSIRVSRLINIQAFFWGVPAPNKICFVRCDNVCMSCIMFGSEWVGEDRMSTADTHLDCPHCHQHLHLFRYTQCKHQSQGHFWTITSQVSYTIQDLRLRTA